MCVRGRPARGNVGVLEAEDGEALREGLDGGGHRGQPHPPSAWRTGVVQFGEAELVPTSLPVAFGCGRIGEDGGRKPTFGQAGWRVRAGWPPSLREGMQYFIDCPRPEKLYSNTSVNTELEKSFYHGGGDASQKRRRK